MDEFIVLSTIKNQQQAKNTLDIALDSIGKGSSFDKAKAQQFLTLILNNVEAKNNPLISKFYSIMMLKQLTQRGEVKVLSLVSGHNLLKYMVRFCKETDPNKPIQQKGKTLFDDKKLGNDYTRLILECLRVWGEKFKLSKNQTPTKFRKYYNQLIEMKVVLPADLKFFNPNILSSTQSEKKVSSLSIPMGSVPKPQQKASSFKPVASSSTFQKDFSYSIQKLRIFIDILSTQQSPQQSIHQYHKMFTKQIQKYQHTLNQMLSNGDQKNTQSVMMLIDFYSSQNNSYKKHIQQSTDYYSYVQGMLIEANKVIDSTNMSNPTSTPNPGKSQSQIKQKQQMRREQPNSRSNNLIKQTISNQNKDLITNLISKMNQKSKNPNVGFKSIKQSLSKDKSLGKSNLRSTSGLKKSSVNKFTKSMSKSKIADIFINPPNPYPQQKRYEGKILQKNQQLSKIMKSISKNQGVRRFITCNFKTKNPLFQNSHLQIGLKSQAVYEQVGEFKVLINIQLYIGNKTQDTIRNMSIQYKGNENVALYGNPRTVDAVLQAGFQNKHELLVVPLSNEFPLIKLQLKYSIKNEMTYQSIVLPNSLVKLAHYRTLSKREFVQSWNNSEIIRSIEFPLSTHISPDSLIKYISSLDNLSSYEQFIVKGSQTDYQVGCLVILKQQFQGVLRISIRPNLNVVLQVGVMDSQDQAYENFAYYMQTLQALMENTQNQL